MRIAKLYIIMETLDAENKKNHGSDAEKKSKLMLILVCVLGATTLLFAILYFTKTSEVKQLIVKEQQTATSNTQLSDELASLLAEHDSLKAAYSDLAEQLSEKDSIIMADAQEIQRLINQQADYNLIKKKMARLQNISKEYVKEMDRLIEENKVLKEENTQLTDNLAKTREEKTAVEQVNQDLTNKINQAATLKAYNIAGRAVYTKTRNHTEVITEKASKARRLKTTLTLAENSLIEPGSYNIYCRISVPGDGRVLTPGKSDAYTFMNDGQRLQYTAKQTVNYVQKAENVTLYWDIRENDKAIKGTYIVQVFSDNGLLGESRFTLN